MAASHARGRALLSCSIAAVAAVLTGAGVVAGAPVAGAATGGADVIEPDVVYRCISNRCEAVSAATELGLAKSVCESICGVSAATPVTAVTVADPAAGGAVPSPEALGPVQQKLYRHFTKAFKGCKKVYFDVGSNVGVQVRKLFEPELYPNAGMLPLFDELFGAGEHRKTDPEICAFGFECNPKQATRLKEIEECYTKKGWKTHFFAPRAVLDTSYGTVTIHTDPTMQNNDWGAGLYGIDNRTIDPVGDFHVPTIDLVDVLTALAASEMSSVQVLMKMDIEGAEYKVLPHLLKNGMLCKSYINKIAAEFHIRAPIEDQYKDLFKGTNHGSPGNVFLGKVAEQQCEGTEFIGVDDESYRMDGLPLPC